MSDLDICKNNWRAMLVAVADDDLIADETARKLIESIDTKASGAIDAYLRADAAPRVALFLERAAERTTEMTLEYRTILSIALAYATRGSVYYEDERALDILLSCLSWGYEHYYGDAELRGEGWRSTEDFNWWDWKIGTPSALLDTMLLLDEHLSDEQKRNYLSLYISLVPEPYDNGSNRINHCKLMIESGLLLGDEKRIERAIEGLIPTFLFADDGANGGAGFYRDGSYIYHTRHPMNFTYGIEHFDRTVYLAGLLRDSRYALPKDRTDIVFSMYERAFLPFYKNGEIARSVMGRYPERALNSAKGFIRTSVRLCECAEGERRERLARIVSHLADSYPEEEGFLSAFNLSDYAAFRRVYKKGIGQACDDGMYSYNSMDRAVYHAKEHAFFLSMSSSRIYNYECINNCNVKGWYHGDGMLALISEPFRYPPIYWECVNPYRIPGTTADEREREAVSIHGRCEYLSSRDFVGSMRAGDFGVAAMQLESYHNEGGESLFAGSEYGGDAPIRSCTLVANKSYFFAGGYAVCLGSGINASDDSRVITVIENRIGKRREDGVYDCAEVTLDGRRIECSEDESSHDGRVLTIGKDAYILLDAHQLLLRKNDGKAPLIEAYISHGVNPKEDSYAYAVLPLTSGEQAETFRTNLPFEIVENSSRAQVLSIKEKDSILAVIYTASDLGFVSTDTPILFCKQGRRICVCDPTRSAKQINITVGKAAYALAPDSHGYASLDL